jgi:GTPase SAR1 family protein
MELSQQQTAKLVLLGEMGSGKSSLVLRYVKGQFFDYQVGIEAFMQQSFAPHAPRVSRNVMPSGSSVHAGIDSGCSLLDKDDSGAQCQVRDLVSVCLWLWCKTGFVAGAPAAVWEL